MKKTLFILVFLLAAGSAFGQFRQSAIKLGYYNPSATDGGFLIGVETGKGIDEVLDVGFSLDWFHKEYVDKNFVNQLGQIYGDIDVQEYEVLASTTLNSFPIMLNVSAHIPIDQPVDLYLTGAIGGDCLLVWYRSFENPDSDELEFAFDFSWRLGAGASYALGSRSNVFFELDYHNSEPSWEYDTELNGVKKIIVREYDMSGIQAKLGLRFYY
jgi:opacity protein-like surface antigen